METALGSDVYESVANYVRSEFGERGTLFGWDWRKRPQPSFPKLDTAIDDALGASRAVEGAAGRPRRAVGALLRRAVHPRVHRGLRRRPRGAGPDGRDAVLGLAEVVLPAGVRRRVAGVLRDGPVVNNDRLQGFAKNLVRALQPLSQRATTRRGCPSAARFRTRPA